MDAVWDIGSKAMISLTIFTFPYLYTVTSVSMRPTKKVSPYFGLKAGYCFGIIGEEKDDYDVYQDGEEGLIFNTSQYQCRMKGLYIRPEVGVRVRKVGIALVIPIVENVRQQTKRNDQKIKSTEDKETSMDVGVNLTVSYNFCF